MPDNAFDNAMLWLRMQTSFKTDGGIHKFDDVVIVTNGRHVAEQMRPHYTPSSMPERVMARKDFDDLTVGEAFRWATTGKRPTKPSRQKWRLYQLVAPNGTRLLVRAVSDRMMQNIGATLSSPTPPPRAFARPASELEGRPFRQWVWRVTGR